MEIIKSVTVSVSVSALFVALNSLHASSLNYSDLVSWTAAVQAIEDDIRLDDYSGFVNGTEIGSAERGPGLVYRPYQGTSLFPRVDNDSPFGGGWLTNRNNGGFDEFIDGFVVDFTEPTFAVSLNDNPSEAVRLRVYGADNNLLGEMSNSTASNFLGIVSTTEQFAYATVINLPPEDGVFAIDNLRIGVGVVPEPATSALLVGAAALFCASVSRRRV
jgi:hypothetical protein